MLTERRLTVGVAAAVAVIVVLSVAFVAGRALTPAARRPVVPGPDRLVDGVSVGFVRSRAGALAAAAHYLLELERAMDTLSVGRVERVAGLVATRSEMAVIAAHAAAVIALERSDGVPVRRVAISTDPVSYSPSAAVVTVLECWLYATSAREALWAIERVTLAWSDGGWRVSAISGAAPSVDESLGQLRGQLAFPGAGDASVR